MFLQVASSTQSEQRKNVRRCRKDSDVRPVDKVRPSMHRQRTVPGKCRELENSHPHPKTAAASIAHTKIHTHYPQSDTSL